MKIKKSRMGEMLDASIEFAGMVITKKGAKALGISRKQAYAVSFGIGAGIALALDMLSDGAPESEDEYEEILTDALIAYPNARDMMFNLTKGASE